MILNIVLTLTCAWFVPGYGFNTFPDSTTSNKKNSNLKLTTRIHSLGLFNYSGRISSNNPAFDINLNYDRHAWGFMMFNVVDMYDQRSGNNFTLALLYKKIKLGNRISITPNTGFAIEQYGREKGDRHIIITAIKINPKLTIDNSMLFANVIVDRHWLDWVNRFRMLYALDEHVDFTFSLWHNNKVFDTEDYFSYGMNMSYSRIKISDRILLNTGVTCLVMAASSDVEMFPKQNGIVFTIGAVFD